jgi:hypothetical protein
MGGFSVNRCQRQNSATLAGHVSGANRADDRKPSPMPFDRVLHHLVLIDVGTD